jgi:hypothetical protein
MFVVETFAKRMPFVRAYPRKTQDMCATRMTGPSRSSAQLVFAEAMTT